MTIRQRLATFTLACSVLSVGVLGLEAGSAGAAPLPTVAIAATVDNISTSAAAALATMGTNAFSVDLESVAYAVGAKLGVDGARMLAAWRAADHFHQVLCCRRSPRSVFPITAMPARSGSASTARV